MENSAWENNFKLMEKDTAITHCVMLVDKSLHLL